MNFGWTADYCLQMSAALFFSLTKNARSIYEDRVNYVLAELCDVVVCAAGQPKYHEALKGIYQKRILGEGFKAPPRHGVFNIAKKDQSMAAAMKLASMLRGGARGR